MAMELSALVAPIMFLGLAELYIQRVLLELKVTTTSDAVKYAQISSTPEKVEATQGPMTDETLMIA